MPNEDMIEQTQFTCPQCGSHEFGTDLTGVNLNRLDLNGGMGVCHGVRRYVRGAVAQYPCGFRWQRRNDALYFRPTGQFIPRTHVGTMH